MPTSYHFTCPTCGRELTITRSIHNPAPEPRCTSCDTPMRRTYQPPGLTFKGKGWGHRP